MRHSKPVRLKTAPTGGEGVPLFFEFTIVGEGIVFTLFIGLSLRHTEYAYYHGGLSLRHTEYAYYHGGSSLRHTEYAYSMVHCLNRGLNR